MLETLFYLERVLRADEMLDAAMRALAHGRARDHRTATALMPCCAIQDMRATDKVLVTSVNDITPTHIARVFVPPAGRNSHHEVHLNFDRSATLEIVRLAHTHRNLFLIRIFSTSAHSESSILHGATTVLKYAQRLSTSSTHKPESKIWHPHHRRRCLWAKEFKSWRQPSSISLTLPSELSKY